MNTNIYTKITEAIKNLSSKYSENDIEKIVGIVKEIIEKLEIDDINEIIKKLPRNTKAWLITLTDDKVVTRLNVGFTVYELLGMIEFTKHESHLIQEKKISVIDTRRECVH